MCLHVLAGEISIPQNPYFGKDRMLTVTQISVKLALIDLNLTIAILNTQFHFSF